MKNRIYTFVGLLFVLTILTVAAAHAQSGARAAIPFDFSVRNKTIAAGEYRISQNTNSAVWTLLGIRNRQSMVLLAPRVEAKREAGAGKLSFHRYGNKYFLAGIETADYKIAVPTSRDERNLMKELNYKRSAKNDGGGAASPEIVTVEISTE